MEYLSWEEYLAKKKIDAPAYKKAAAEQYALFQQQFLQMHPDSFTAHKLFLINEIRRSYPLLPATETEKK